MNTIVEIIEPKPKLRNTKTDQIIRKKRVAAYARVSSGKDAMLHSLSAQVNQYKKLIHENPEWLFVGVYADEALTGTKDSRTGAAWTIPEWTWVPWVRGT